MSDPDDGKTVPAPASDRALLQRSDVPPGLKYRDYIEYLRPDFFFSCAYCTMSEFEASAIRFTIDHYEPKRHRPDLENMYGNLMYCCDPCNMYKGDRMPSAETRERGFRFYRPDEDHYEDHFEKKERLLGSKTKIGEFTIKAVDLNRPMLRKLRELRERATQCDEYVRGGLRALRHFSLDQLPPTIRGRAVSAIADASKVGGDIVASIDELLMENGRSPLVDPDEEKKIRARERLEKLRQMEGLSPGILKGVKR
jgi:hypothetical protein